MEAYKPIPKFSTPEGCWWASDIEYSFVDLLPPYSTVKSKDKEEEARGANRDHIWWRSTGYQLAEFDCL